MAVVVAAQAQPIQLVGAQEAAVVVLPLQVQRELLILAGVEVRDKVQQVEQVVLVLF
jgi:hypothetical protein